MRLRLDAIAPALLFIVTRSFGHPKILYNTDAVQFALGIEHFDLMTHQPHPPGYIWFILLARIFKWFTRDDLSALVYSSIFLGLVTLILIQVFTERHFGRRAGFLAALFFCFSPMSWFFSVVGLNYISDALISIATAILFFTPFGGETKSTVFIRALVGAMIIGFRPQAIIFVIPAWLYFIAGCKGRRLAAFGGFLAGTISWIGVTCIVAGMWNIFTPAVEHALRPEVSGYSNLVPSLSKFRFAFWQMRVYTLFTLLWFGVVFFLFSLLWLLLRGGVRGKFRGFFLIWTLPHILFSLLVFIIQPGHFVFLLPPLLLLLAVPLARIGKVGCWRQALSYGLSLLVVVSMAVYTMYFGSYKGLTVGYQEIFNNDAIYRGAFKLVTSVDDWENSIVLTEYFRHVFYYLPEVHDVGFAFYSLNKLGDNPLVLPAGRNGRFSPMKAETVDAEKHIYRLELKGEYAKVIYLGRGKWISFDRKLKAVGSGDLSEPLVSYLTLHPNDYIYFGPKREWWVGDASQVNPPEI